MASFVPQQALPHLPTGLEPLAESTRSGRRERGVVGTMARHQKGSHGPAQPGLTTCALKPDPYFCGNVIFKR